MPRSNRFGVQLEWGTESADRHAADTADVRRRHLLLRARGTIGDRTQIEAYTALSDYRLAVAGLAEGEAEPTRDADVVGFRLATRPGSGFASVETRFSGGAARPSNAWEAAAAWPLGRVRLEGGAELGSWRDFSTLELRAAGSVSGRVLWPATLRIFAGAGDRGVGIPAADTAAKVGFDQQGIEAELAPGPFRLSTRLGRQALDRQLAFGATWDAGIVLDSGAVEIRSLEVRAEGPLIPLGGILPGLEPIRVSGFYRRNSNDGAPVLYVPEDVSRVELSLHDTFFDGNLELWLGAFVERRGTTLSPRAGEVDPVLRSGYTWPGGHVMFKIGDFRFFYRLTNPSALDVSDIPGARFPASLGVFGLRWEFFN